MRTVHRKIKKATATRKGRIIVFTILFLILGAIAGGLIYWQTYKKQIIREKLESAIHEKSGGLYTLKYDSLKLDEINGYLSIKNLSLTYDSLRYLSLKEQGKAPSVLLTLHIPEINITGVKTPRALIDKEINGDRLEIKDPVIDIMYTMEGKDSARNVPDKEVYEQILGGLSQISLDTAIIIGAHINTHNLKTKRDEVQINNVSIQFVDLLIDSTGNADTSRLFFSKQVMLAAEDVNWKSKGKPYAFALKNISVSSSSRMAIVRSFEMNPLLGEAAFVNSLPTQEDRFDFSLQNIMIKNIDFASLLKEELTADSMLIKSSSFKIYRDLNKPRDTKNRVGTYPSQVLMRLPLLVDIKRLLIEDSYVEYRERNKITKQTGNVHFNNVYAGISNLTNKKEKLAQNSTINIDINSRFLNKAPFKSSWVFFPTSSDGKFTIKGSLGSINAEDLNAVTVPMGPARMEKGSIQSLDFDLAGNDYSMKGTVKLLYDDLKISLLEKDKDSKELDKKSLTSFIANILVKNSNPSGKKDEPRVITVTNERDTNRSIFHLTWKTIFKGVKETMGIKK